MKITRKEDIKTNIYIDYEKTKSLVFNRTNNHDDIDFINSINIEFLENEKSNCLAFSYFSKEKKGITFNIDEHDYFYSTIIHELAHLICIEHLKIRNHSLEFALISSALLLSICKIDRVYMNSYDFHEDYSSSSLKINAEKYELFVKSIKWKNFKEISLQAKQIAVIIRQQSYSLTSL